jgi:4-hydroxy-3-polyprenylbenzoate decarboxylase
VKNLPGYIVGITGASGSIYAVRLLEELLKRGNDVHLVITGNGKKVLEYELEHSLDYVLDGMMKQSDLHLYDIDDLFAPIASGSFRVEGMAVVPCSMSTMGEIAWGASKNLLGRAADVCIKEKRKLVLVPRETPLSTLHLRNMLELGNAGVTILPAMPAFYQRPRSMDDIVNFIVGRVMDSLGIKNELFMEWGVNND